jgi:hypothetical protein
MARSWDEGRREGRWDKQHLSKEEERRIQSGIDATMKAIIRDRHYDPIHALDGGMVNVTPVGAPAVTTPGVPLSPGVPQASEPWIPMHPVQDWLRLGSTVPDANLKSAEAALAKLGEEKEG